MEIGLNCCSYALKRRVIRLFNSEYVDKSTNRHNQTAYLNARAYLGSRYVLAIPVGRKHKSETTRQS